MRMSDEAVRVPSSGLEGNKESRKRGGAGVECNKESRKKGEKVIKESRKKGAGVEGRVSHNFAKKRI